MKKVLFAGILGGIMSISSLEAGAQTTTKSRSGKDALIGAGAGAVTGAVVSKHKKKGALIGGAVGAAGGYAYGKHQDKKKGRRVVRKH
ncbi:MAG: YMGG-like glycine zipper-containing protein [Ferruginibacter sp.]